MPHYARTPAPQLIPLQHTGKPPLFRISIPSDFKDLLVGATLGGRYWVLSVIGRGGMSVVYKAKVKDTGKIVAVKTLRTQSMTDDMVVKRFQREAELLSRLNHPRIVNLHAYGSSARGQPYFVMDYLMGENLTTVLKREDHLDPERFQDIFVQVCAAIEHAHRHGAIHRDIKPGNIMLTRQGRTNDYVKVVDFGIAKMAEEAQRLTRMGEVWGSPIYMSPEQCMGATVDERSDIYSLGIVMYESLTGKVPFLGRNYADTMTKQISDNPAPFSQIRPDLKIPYSLEKVVMSALEKQPESRYQSLGLMRKDIESALSQKVTSDMPIPISNAAAKINKPKASLTNLRKPEETKKPVEKKPEVKKVEAKKKPDAKADGKINKRISSSKKEFEQAAKKKRRTTQSMRQLDEFEVPPVSRGRQLLIVASSSLLFSIVVITIMTHGDTISHVLANMVKMLVSGLDEESSPYSELRNGLNTNDSAPNQPQTTTSTTTGGEPLQTETNTTESQNTQEKQ